MSQRIFKVLRLIQQKSKPGGSTESWCIVPKHPGFKEMCSMEYRATLSGFLDFDSG